MVLKDSLAVSFVSCSDVLNPAVFSTVLHAGPARSTGGRYVFQHAIQLTVRHTTAIGSYAIDADTNKECAGVMT